ncbi:MAG: hypothetical protein FJ008_05175 [Chloroflexi bacterium]|nr:hypothetical protein [Chloroflexota bacterium]MBM3173386.1 hypothetical protein [Chloroflexota bacterium]MBM3174568.1 hypothetical protein [Chloroflexota bacterium]MBM4451182.1 hypothetical protein [Chloroflexota bacterium]
MQGIEALEQLRPYLIERYLEWVDEQREILLPQARPLSKEERARFQGYFEERILDLVRVATVDRIRNPEFYNELTMSGMPIPLDFNQAVGLALVDCIIIHKQLWTYPESAISTIFHELVHVVQIDMLGIRKHIELYADSLMQNDLQYHSVIFERQAYDLTARFDRKEPPFSVSKAIKQGLRQARLI